MTVLFDDPAAERCIAAAQHASSQLRGQGRARRIAAEHAARGSVGAFVDLFARACTVEAEDRVRLASTLEEFAAQLHRVRRAAQDEQARELRLAEWDALNDVQAERLSHPLGAFVQGNGTAQAGNAGWGARPQDAPHSPPPVSIQFRARPRTRVPEKTAPHASGADPTALGEYAALARAHNYLLEGELSALWGAWSWLVESSPWMRVTDNTVLTGFRAFLAENEADVRWATRIAAAFRSAGDGRLSPARLRQLGTTPQPELTDADLLAALATATDRELGTLATTVTGLGAQLRQLDRRAVADWWRHLGVSAMPGELGEQQSLLLQRFPEVLGNLDGIPVDARVQAHALHAPGVMRTIRVELRRVLEGELPGGRQRVEMLREEFQYMQRVAAGEIKLYLHDREDSRIVEVLGTPGPDTARIVTYVPGTFTTLGSFYSGRVQQIGVALSQGAPGTLVFVYKDGEFPGEERMGAGPQPLRIREANRADAARVAGEQLMRFHRGVRTDAGLSELPRIGVGHSWGLTNLAASEVAGARYDTVVSLSGAGMPREWRGHPGTGYFDLSYQDLLQGAQRQGYVWRGNTPRRHPGFAKFPLYRGPHDAVLESTAFRDTPQKLRVLAANHALIATTDGANKRALEDLERLVKQ